MRLCHSISGPAPSTRIKLYTDAIVENEKEIRWVGSAYDDLLAFPKDSRKELGFQLGKVQAGLDPADWKPSARGKNPPPLCLPKMTQALCI